MTPRRSGNRMSVYRPDLLSVKFSPRVTLRLWRTIRAVCRRADMAESEVLRYGFEAAVMLCARGKLRLRELPGDAPLDAMVTVRASKRIGRLVPEILAAYPKIDKAEVLRRLLREIMEIAREKGMARVMVMREENIQR